MIDILLILLVAAGIWFVYNYRRRPDWVKRKIQAVKDKFK